MRGKNFCKTPPQNVLLMSIYDREIIYLSWTRKNTNREENKMKSDTSWKCFFKSVFQCMTEKKTLEENAEQNLDYWAKCSTLYFASQNSVLCEAVDLIEIGIVGTGVVGFESLCFSFGRGVFVVCCIRWKKKTKQGTGQDQSTTFRGLTILRDVVIMKAKLAHTRIRRFLWNRKF